MEKRADAKESVTSPELEAPLPGAKLADAKENPPRDTSAIPF